MTNEELRDIAYRTATANHLTEILDYKAFQDISEEDLMNMLWEPIEYWDYGTVVDHISGIAEGFISAVNYCENSNEG